MADKLIIFDTTLRDGEQSPGASMTKDEKLRIARQLERLKVDVIEAGFAASSNGDFEAVQAIANAIKDSTICSLSRANDRDISRAAEALRGANSARIHTFIATSPLHMEKKLRMTPEQVLEQAKQSVRFARNLVSDIEFSPEDGYRSEPDFLCRVLEAVIAEGATTINVPDTVGYAIPELYGNFIKTLRERIPNSDKAIWSVHCHNDLGMAVANSLAGVMIGGARQVECTINGLGERAGNCSLEEVVMAIKTRRDYFNLDLAIDTQHIVAASRMVSQTTGFVVTGFTQDETGVDVNLSDGQLLRADYLVGCDGGRSLIRKQAGIEFLGWDATTSWLIAEVEMTEEPAWGIRRGEKGVNALGKLEDEKYVGAVLVEPQVSQGTEPTLSDLRNALIAFYGTDFGAHHPRWLSRFTDMARQAASYRHRRILLAGDAAHVHAPAGGQGLNIGVQDAVNLGWKLAQVVKGLSPDSLLDTYHAERHPIGARVLRLTMAQTALGRGDDCTEALRETMTDLLHMDAPRKRYASATLALCQDWISATMLAKVMRYSDAVCPIWIYAAQMAHCAFLLYCIMRGLYFSISVNPVVSISLHGQIGCN